MLLLTTLDTTTFINQGVTINNVSGIQTAAMKRSAV